MSLLRRSEALLPFALSLAALALIAGYVLLVGPGVSTNHDEGVAARFFQLIIAVDLVAITAFAVRWVPRDPRLAAGIVAVQLLAVAAPVLVVLTLEG